MFGFDPIFAQGGNIESFGPYACLYYQPSLQL